MWHAWEEDGKALGNSVPHAFALAACEALEREMEEEG